MTKTTVCVYGGSSSSVDGSFLHAAGEFGRLCAEKGIEIVCGGGRTGMMAAMINGCIAAGGSAVGVLPDFMIDRGWYHASMSRRIETPDMHTRKRRMVRDAVAAVALPGGIGTFDELCEIITWRQLGLFTGSIVILNLDGYYDDFLKMMDHGVETGFVASSTRGLWKVASTPAEVIDMMLE